MVIIERRHHPVGRVAIKAELCVVDDGVDTHDAEAGDVKPDEPIHVLRVLEQHGAQEERRDDEPQPGKDELDGYYRHFACDGSHHHPNKHAIDDDGDRMTRDALVVLAVIEHLGNEKQKDAHQQWLGWQRYG